MDNAVTRRGFLGGVVAAGMGLATVGTIAQAAENGSAVDDASPSSANGDATPLETAADDKVALYHQMAQLNADDTSDWRSNSIEDFANSKFFEHWNFGAIEMDSRMVKSAAGSLYLPGVTDERIIDEYVELVKGGTTFVWVEDYANLYTNYPASYKVRDRSNAILDQVAAAVHEAGGKLGYQLSLMGASFSGFDATTAEEFESAHADDMTLDELHLLQDDFVDAAKLIKDSGFDAIEINAAGNNIGQAFLSRNRNARDDEYGPQSFENRTRFLCEIIERIKKENGADFPIQVLINGIEANDVNIGQDGAMTTVEENCEMVKYLEAAGANSLHVRLGPFGYHPCEFASDMYFSGYGINGNNRYATQFDFDRHWEGLLDGHHSGAGMMLNVAAKIKQAVSIPVGTVTYMDPAHAPDFFEKALEDGKCDFFLMTRPFYADPEYVNKLREGRIGEIRPCNRCLHCHFDLDEDGNFYEHCRVNATRMRAFTDEMPDGPALPELQGEPRKVMVVGGGPAGMECARVAAERGHEVTLYEKTSSLGGRLPIAAAFKGQHENISDFEAYLEKQQDLQGVTVVTNTEVTADLVQQEAPDVVVCAVGGTRQSSGLTGTDATNVVSIDDVAAAQVGEHVTIIGGNAQSVDLAWWLIAQGKHVTIVMDKPVAKLGDGQSDHIKEITLPMLYVKGTRVWDEASVTAVGEGEITINNASGADITFACDTIVEALDLAPNSELADAVEALGIEAHVVGDALDIEQTRRPHNIAEAIATGNLTARAL